MDGDKFTLKDDGGSYFKYQWFIPSDHWSGRCDYNVYSRGNETQSTGGKNDNLFYCCHIVGKVRLNTGVRLWWRRNDSIINCGLPTMLVSINVYFLMMTNTPCLSLLNCFNDCLIDWCLTQCLAVFQLYRGVKLL